MKIKAPKCENPRESYDHYVGPGPEETAEMLKAIDLSQTQDLFSHIGSHTGNEVIMDTLDLPNGLSRDQLAQRLSSLAKKNRILPSFIGDGLQDFKVPEVFAKICQIRGLTTAYTPYQPERSQGTLQSLWIYQSAMSAITGFEAINASLYERSTALFEALSCSLRIQKKKSKVLVSKNLFPGDLEVIQTLAQETEMIIELIELNPETSLIDQERLMANHEDDIACIAFPQVNCFGQIERFNDLTNIAKEKGWLSIGVIDPVYLSNNGLKNPSCWGKDSLGVDMIVGEAQHLALPLNYGGPGLGLFGVRFNEQNKTHIRQAAGRFIGKTLDEFGEICKSIVLSTREQHIRREKATSNICSNQSFVATVCGANLLSLGDVGLDQKFRKCHEQARFFAQEISKFEGVDLKFKGAFVNELTVEFKNEDIDELIHKASNAGVHIGTNISKRAGISGNLLLISLSDKQTSRDLNQFLSFMRSNFKQKTISANFTDLYPSQRRTQKFSIPRFNDLEIIEYYRKLGEQNLSPDDGIYPLGSCTMKYNPEINDWAAGLAGFSEAHPQAPAQDVQGNLEILFETQHWFKKITGLPGVTTQPVAGAQGELVGLKMFQAYHRDRKESEKRNIVIIPNSAHGTNPATASMAGFINKTVDGKKVGIIGLSADDRGEMDFAELEKIVAEYGESIAGIMVTNPNTAGIFETNFKKMSDLIHSVGGLVYMDGANMNAIAGHIDLGALGVDAVHNNLHKTWSIPHGGGGPGDAIVAVSDKLIDYLPGLQVKQNEHGDFETFKPMKSIGSFHRHHGNFGHKVRAYTYLLALGGNGIRKMSATATLSAKYLFKKLNSIYPTLPATTDNPRMHEFILTLDQNMFEKLAKAGTPKAKAIARVGKLFLDFGFHAPTVAFPEQYGLMIEPTESFTKAELDLFAEVVKNIHKVIHEYPQVLQTVPHFTPVGQVDEVGANKNLAFCEEIKAVLPSVAQDLIAPEKLRNMGFNELSQLILKRHEEKLAAHE